MSFQDWPTAGSRGHFLVSKHIIGTHTLQMTNTLSGPQGRSQSGRPRGKQNLPPQSKSKRVLSAVPSVSTPVADESGLPAMSQDQGFSEKLGRMSNVHLCGIEPLGVPGPHARLTKERPILSSQSGDGSCCPEPLVQHPASQACVPSCSPCVGSHGRGPCGF